MPSTPNVNLEPTANVNLWLDHIQTYEREFKAWEGRSTKIGQRYRGDRKETNTSTKFNILWSNVQTLSGATFAKLPKPDVARRHNDQDDVGRVASLILERALDYEITKYSDYSDMLEHSIQDRFLGGRGTAWVRYEPHMRAAKQQMPQDGVEVTEDVDNPNEELDYECAPCDYVHWRDFGHVVARTWEEVPAVWRKVYLSREQCVERFGEELGGQIPLDSRPETDKEHQSDALTEQKSRALIYEIWDKTTKQALWLSKSLGKFVDQQDDPLGLEEFFPCPRPLYATLTNDSLVPSPDFTLYQDQADELDTLANRIDGLIKALKVMGVYDASAGDLQRLFTEGENASLVPVTDWMAFAEKNGLKGAIDIVDLTPIANALREAYLAFEQIKAQIDEITGIADIVRGQTAASETATAQQIKGNFVGLRMKGYQKEVGRYAGESIQIKAQIICGKFSPKTILMISAADQLPQADQQLIPQALALLIGPERMQNPDAPAGPNPLRCLRIEIAADSMVEMDEAQEKQDRTEFLTAVGGFMGQAQQIIQAQPALLPLMAELLKFVVRAFKVGKTVESAFESAIQNIQKQPPSPTEEQIKQLEQSKKQAEQAQAQMEQQKKALDQQQGQMRDQQFALEKAQMMLEAKAQEVQTQMEKLQSFHENNQAAQQAQLAAMDQAHEKNIEATRLMFEKWKAELDAQTKVAVAELSAQTTLQAAQLSAADAESKS